MIKAILFDFMGVCLFKRSDYSPEVLVDEIDSTIGKVTDDVLFKQETISKYYLTNEQFEDLLDKIVDKYEKFESLWNMLPKLKNKYKLAIINNGTSLTLSKLKERHQVSKYFDLFVSSAIEGIKKPDPKIYLLTASYLKVKPEECLFMDDSEKNVEGAKNVGMKTIWWKTKEKGFKKFIDFLKNN